MDKPQDLQVDDGETWESHVCPWTNFQKCKLMMVKRGNVTFNGGENVENGWKIAAALMGSYIGADGIAVATVIGTLVAFLIVPMRSLGADGWKIAAALMGSYIGGVSEALGVSPSIVAAGVAADNLICAIYFMALFALASRIPPEAAKSTTDLEDCSRLKSTDKLPVLPTATGIAISFAICKLSSFFATRFGLQGGVLPIATTVVVALAIALPQVFTYLAPSGDAISLILMQMGDRNDRGKNIMRPPSPLPKRPEQNRLAGL